LPTRWYAVDEAAGVVYDEPFRSRRRLMAALGLETSGRNGAIAARRLAKLPLRFVRGAALTGRRLTRKPAEGFRSTHD
jgi:hypothetical protein